MDILEQMAQALQKVCAYYNGENNPMGAQMALVARKALQAYELSQSNAKTSEKCAVCGNRTAYHGWPNYETWELNLELENDAGSYDVCLEMANEATDVYGLSQSLKDYWEEVVDEILQARGMKDGISGIPFSSLYRMDSVDWYAIAKSWWEQREEEEEANACPDCDGVGYQQIATMRLDCECCNGTGLLDSEGK